MIINSFRILVDIVDMCCLLKITTRIAVDCEYVYNLSVRVNSLQIEQYELNKLLKVILIPTYVVNLVPILRSRLNFTFDRFYTWYRLFSFSLN